MYIYIVCTMFISLLKYESSSTQMQTNERSMSLKGGMVLYYNN